MLRPRLLGDLLSFLFGETLGERDLDRERVRFLACVLAFPPDLASLSAEQSRSCLMTEPLATLPLEVLRASPPRVGSSASFLSVHLFFSFSSSSLALLLSDVRFFNLGSFFGSADFWFSASICLFLLWTHLVIGEGDLDFSSSSSFRGVLFLSGPADFSGVRAVLFVVAGSVFLPEGSSLAWDGAGGPVRFRRGSLVAGLGSTCVCGGIHGRITGAVGATGLDGGICAAEAVTGVVVVVGTTKPAACKEKREFKFTEVSHALATNCDLRYKNLTQNTFTVNCTYQLSFSLFQFQLNLLLLQL